MRLSASQLGAWERCPTQYRFERIEKRQGVGLSATVYGTVMHHALHAFERKLAELLAVGQPQPEAITEALDVALATFDYYWHPLHVEEVAGQQVDVWLRFDSYGSLRQKGLNTLRHYAELWPLDKHELLSLEHAFEVPVDGTEHTISGYVDRLVVRYRKRVPVLDTDDWKSGKLKTYLRHHLGLTVYAYASTKIEFWLPFAAQGLDPEEMHARYADLPRHTNWYDLKGLKIVDAGFRGPIDYRRLARACEEVARSVEAGIFPLRISGETCEFCPHRAYCPDGVEGLPDESHGAPVAAS